MLVADQQQVQEHGNEGPNIQSASGAALEEQKTFSRQIVEEKEDEISALEPKIAATEAAGSGTHFFISEFYFMTSPGCQFLVINFSSIPSVLVLGVSSTKK